jgi:hypothetical protein
VLSSQIEGTQATLVDLLNFESGKGQANPDIIEVCNYVEALNYAREQLASKRGLPLSTRLFNETHRLLMRGVRGAGKVQTGSDAARTGSVVPGPETLHSYHRPRVKCLKHLRCLKNTSTGRTRYRPSFTRVWCTFSSRRFTPISGDGPRQPRLVHRGDG